MPSTPAEKIESTAFLFFRDLRLRDHAGLAAAAHEGRPVLAVAWRSPDALAASLANPRQISIARGALGRIDEILRGHGSGLLVSTESPELLADSLVREYSVRCLHRCYGGNPDEERALRAVDSACELLGISVFRHHDATILPVGSVLKPDGLPYRAYAPYARTASTMIRSSLPADLGDLAGSIPWYRWSVPRADLPTTHEEAPPFPDFADYAARREEASWTGASNMSLWLRWGVIGPKELARRALAADSQKYLDELLWREFFMDGFFQYPETAREEWRPETRSADWSRDERAFALWQEGKTGYPLVDAAMRELAATGRLHNRFRMLTANFLCKILRIDWRWGERHFAQQLRDYEPALNVGNWQWSAGTGTDAAPYFRVFNPALQAEKHDPSGAYVRQWIPEIGTPAYPDPIVNFSEARKKYLSWWKDLIAKSGG